MRCDMEVNMWLDGWRRTGQRKRWVVRPCVFAWERTHRILRSHKGWERATFCAHIRDSSDCTLTCASRTWTWTGLYISTREGVSFPSLALHASAWRHVQMRGGKGRGLKTALKNVGYRRAEGSFPLGTGSDRYFPFRRRIREPFPVWVAKGAPGLPSLLGLVPFSARKPNSSSGIEWYRIKTQGRTGVFYRCGFIAIKSADLRTLHSWKCGSEFWVTRSRDSPNSEPAESFQVQVQLRQYRLA